MIQKKKNNHKHGKNYSRQKQPSLMKIKLKFFTNWLVANAVPLKVRLEQANRIS